MNIAVALLLLMVVGGFLFVGGLVYMLLKSGKNHPANLSSQSRRSVRPVTEALERLERLVAQNKDKAEVSVIGPQALEAARTLRAECLRWATARDELATMSDGGGTNDRAAAVVAKIDEKLAEAAQSIDDMAARIGERAVSTYDMPDDNSLDELVGRLESLSQSMDEAQDTLDVRLR